MRVNEIENVTSVTLWDYQDKAFQEEMDRLFPEQPSLHGTIRAIVLWWMEKHPLAELSFEPSKQGAESHNSITSLKLPPEDAARFKNMVLRLHDDHGHQRSLSSVVRAVVEFWLTHRPSTKELSAFVK